MRALVLLAFVFGTSQLLAQKPDDQAAQAKASQEQLLAAQAQGAASATRPGDDELSCEALQMEFLAITQNPQLLASIQAGGAEAQAQLDQLNQVQEAQAAVKRPGIFRTMVQGAASSVVPGAGQAAARAQQAAQAAQAAQMQVQAEKNVQSMQAQGAQLSASAGPMMRGQHLMELAQARKCEWMAQVSGEADSESAPAPEPKRRRLR
jgi:hypothetical protein